MPNAIWTALKFPKYIEKGKTLYNYLFTRSEVHWRFKYGQDSVRVSSESYLGNVHGRIY